MHQWEVLGVGHVDPQLVSGAAVHGEADGTVMVGTWNQEQFIEITRLLMRSGFVVQSIRRLDAHP
jgi:hypothetical protein